MPESPEDIELRTEEVQDILSHVPHWIMRWGSASIFSVLLIFILISCFLRYPTTIRGSIKLTTKSHPIKIVSKVSGKLERLYISEGAEVSIGSQLALIENTVTSESIDFLRMLVPKIHSFLAGTSSEIDNLDTNLSFGNLQGDYNSLVKKLKDYQYFKQNQYYSSKINSLKEQIDHYKNLDRITQTQLILSNNELINAQEKYETEKKLYEDKVISRVDFIKAENDFIRQKRDLQSEKKYFEEVKITELEYLKQCNDLKFEQTQKEVEYSESVRQSVKIIESSINSWQQVYELQAPVAGHVFFLKEISEKQHVAIDDEVFVIVPLHQDYICVMNVSSPGFGKLKAGQKVRIKLDNYPFHEFGQLTGIIKTVPQVPFNELSDQSNTSSVKAAHYRVVVELVNSGKTSYNKILSINPEMTGTGEVAINDLTLFERVFYQIKGNLDN